MQKITSFENLLRLVHLLKRELLKQLEELNLLITPMHIRVIKIISNKSFCTAMDIVHVLDRDKAQITRLIKSLIEKKFVKKLINVEDKRSQYLVLTKKGLAVLTQIAQIDAEIFTRMTKNFTEQDLNNFERITGQLINNL